MWAFKTHPQSVVVAGYEASSGAAHVGVSENWGSLQEASDELFEWQLAEAHDGETAGFEESIAELG
ncbi:hypothetical protein MYFR107205_30025 [Mycolicibacterium frederiksbergense]